MNLKSKTILLICPTFFGYEKAIAAKLEEWGAKVDLYDERPANSFLDKGLIRINKKILTSKINKYYEQIYTEISDKSYDYILVINIEAMPCKFLSLLREKNPSARFILYMWDSVHNKKNTPMYFPYFDVIYSFDKTDCLKYPNIKFRPLFYLDEYESLKSNDSNHNYDVCFIGTGHSDRFFILEGLENALQTHQMKHYKYVYLQSEKLFYWNKLTNKYFKNIKVSHCNYEPLSKEVVLDKIKDSKIIVDIQHPLQKGLTMRTIEMLGAQKKIITTNASVKEYDFYKPENIWIVDREHPSVSDEFLKSDYVPLDENLYHKYSIGGWLEEILS